MARFDFVVDTKPMADSVNSITGHVDATTAAVIAMQAAVIHSEEQAAKKICDNVDSGFYNLIRSQISMKLATYFTEMNAKLALLMEYAKALSKSKNRMECDFYRLRRDYLKIFRGLDSTLETRVAQLDKHSMNLADTRKRVILGKFLREVPETTTIFEETYMTEQRIVSARLKSKTSRSLKFLGNKVHENVEYAELMDSHMEKMSVDKEYEEYIPVVYSSEQSMLMNESFVLQLYYPEYLSESTKNCIGLDILSQIDSVMDNPLTDNEKQEISKEFCNIVANTTLDSRVSKVIMELFERGGC